MVTGLGNNNTVVGSNLDITLNGNLSLCHVPSICNYLVNPPAGAVINISANKIDCNSQTEILAKCALRITSILSFENQMSIFPNPVLDVFIIDLKSNEEMSATLFDIYGKVIDTFAFNQRYTGDLSNHLNGIYFLKLNNQQGKQHIIKIVKL